MAGTDAKTPAPKEDQIHGSKRNAEDSASSGKSKSVKFSASTEKTLSEKVKNHNEKAPEGRKATLGMLKAVYRRGAGAFSKSHRPGMVRDQWAMGRVNAYLRLLKSGRPENPNYTTDNDLLPAAHPKSSKKKSASVSGFTAGAALVPEEKDLAEALLEVVSKHGKFNEDETGVWAGYTPPSQNEVASIGVTCLNCVFYEGGDKCKIIALPVEPTGKCRFAVIPDGVVDASAIDSYKNGNKLEILDELEHIQDLTVTLKGEDEYSSPEEAILALTEYLGLGYEAEPAIRASWIRGVNLGESPYQRALNMAEYSFSSNDADLLPKPEKGVFS